MAFPHAEVAPLPVSPACAALMQQKPAPGTETGPLPWALLSPVEPGELLWA